MGNSELIAYLEISFHFTIAITAVTYVYYCWRTSVPVVPTPATARQTIVQAIIEEAQQRQGQPLVILDLGSGTGGLCLDAARALPESQVIGLELAFPVWLWSVMRARWRRQKNVKFILTDLWDYDIGSATVIVTYLGIHLMPRLSEKLLQQPHPGRLIISNTFALPEEWKPFRVIPTPAMLSKKILLYRQK